MTFRHSDYIDFDTDHVKVPPMAIISAWGPRASQSYEQMLTAFECRIDVWFFGPAVAMLRMMEAPRAEDSVWAHSGYTLLGTLIPYFEMIGKILNPMSSIWRSSKTDFSIGFRDVYPTLFNRGTAESDAICQFRDRLRNGIFHLGYTKSRLFIHHAPDRWADDFMVVAEHGHKNYLVNPHNLTRTLVAHFPGLVARLRQADTESSPLRRKFVEFYVKFHEADQPGVRMPRGDHG